MTLKPGVRITGIKTELVPALMVCDSVYRSLGYEMVVTSVVDGKHSAGSLHYAGMAFDLRTNDLKPDAIAMVLKSIRDQIGIDFDVVLESDHIHCEFQPKEPL